MISNIEITYDDGTIASLSFDAKNKQFVRIVKGTKENPCFAVTTMTFEDMERQLHTMIKETMRQMSHD